MSLNVYCSFRKWQGIGIIVLTRTMRVLNNSCIVQSRPLELLLARPLRDNATADAEHKHEENSEQTSRPCPRGCRPGIRIVYKHLDQRIEKILFEIVEQATSAVQEIAVGD